MNNVYEQPGFRLAEHKGKLILKITQVGCLPDIDAFFVCYKALLLQLQERNVTDARLLIDASELCVHMKPHLMYYIMKGFKTLRPITMKVMRCAAVCLKTQFFCTIVQPMLDRNNKPEQYLPTLLSTDISICKAFLGSHTSIK